MNKIKDQLYLELLEQRKILINDDITDDIIEKVVMKIIEWNEEDDALEDLNSFDRNSDPIQIYLDTSGGDTTAALSLVSAIKSSSTPVIVIALGKCMSAGIIILAAATKAVCQKYTSLMWHEISGGRRGSLTDIKVDTDYMDKLQNIAVDIIVDKINITKTEFQNKYVNIDWYFFPEEAIELGLVDEII